MGGWGQTDDPLAFPHRPEAPLSHPPPLQCDEMRLRRAGPHGLLRPVGPPAGVLLSATHRNPPRCLPNATLPIPREAPPSIRSLGCFARWGGGAGTGGMGIPWCGMAGESVLTATVRSLERRHAQDVPVAGAQLLVLLTMDWFHLSTIQHQIRLSVAALNPLPAPKSDTHDGAFAGLSESPIL